MHWNGKTKEEGWRNCLKKEAVLGLNIPPLWSCCMSSCNQNCNNPSSTASALKYQLEHPTFSCFFFVATAILGFLMRNLNLRLMRALLSFLFFFFNFLLFLCHRPKWSMVLSWMILSSLFCSFKVSFSFWMCLFKTSNS